MASRCASRSRLFGESSRQFFTRYFSIAAFEGRLWLANAVFRSAPFEEFVDLIGYGDLRPITWRDVIRIILRTWTLEGSVERDTSEVFLDAVGH